MTGVQLSLTGGTVAYRPPLLTNLDLECRPAATTAVTGPSGCGKSTLLYVLGLFLRLSAGSLTVNGQDVKGWSDQRRSRFRATQVGFVFQDARLDRRRSAVANVTEALEYAGVPWRDQKSIAHSTLERLGLNAIGDDRSAHLSGGEAQRVGLARAVAKGPGLILADEPTGNLDERSASVVFDELVSQAAAGTTVLIVTHDRDIARECDDWIDFE